MIIKTLADTDLYKMTMGNAVNQHFPEANVTYELKVRSKVTWHQNDVDNIINQINGMSNVTFQEEELAFMQTRCKYLPWNYLTFLRGLRLDPSHVKVWLENDVLKLTINGLWGQEIYWETLLMPIISECYFETRAILSPYDLDQAYENARRKAKKLRDLGAYFIDMGTRRRRSYSAHNAVIRGLIDGGNDHFLGTSNVHFATKYNITPHGTMAHELFSAVAAMYGVENANNIVLGKWVDTYHGLLGIALPDTFTTDFFLKTFNPFYAKLFDGVRHDSGNPIEWVDTVINHYESLGINPKSKKAVFSDGLDSFDRVKEIIKHVNGQMMVTFGIGTWFTNDFPDFKALNMVIKLTEAQKNPFEPRRHAVKLSDAPSKHNGDKKTVQEYLERINN